MKRLMLNIAVFLFSWLLGLDHAQAHRADVFAWVEGDTVHVESKFSGGKKMKAGKISVVDPKGNELVKGVTNEQGEFSFKIPKKTEDRFENCLADRHRTPGRMDNCGQRD
jgi:nickel transport protein